MPQSASLKRLLVIPALALTLLGLLLFAACSSDDDPVTPPPGGGDPDISGTLGAAGGTLTSGDGTVSFTLPPGALATDTEITIAPLTGADLPDLGTGMDVIAAWSMSPSGLDLAADGTLEVDLDWPGTGKGVQKRELGFAVAVVSGEHLENIPEGGVQEALEMTVNQNTGQSTGVLHLRGLSGQVVVARPQSIIEGTNHPTITINQEWDSAPRLGDEFTYRLGFEVSKGLDITGTIDYVHQDMSGLSINLNDGDALVPDTEFETQDGGYQRNYFPSVTATSVGAAPLKFAMEYELTVDYSQYYDDGYEAPEINGNTLLTHILADADLTVQPQDDSGEFLPLGLYTSMGGLEGVTLLVAPGYKYDGAAAVSGNDGTIFYDLAKDTAWAVRSNFFNFQGSLAYGSFIVSEGLDQEPPQGLTYVQYGPSGILVNPYDTEIDDHGWSQLGYIGQNVTDGQPFWGATGSGGYILSNNSLSLAAVFKYNADSGFFDQEGQINQFENSTGSVVTAGVMPDGNAIIVADGSPGRIYLHDRLNYSIQASYLGDAGDSPRRFRSAGNLGAISNFGSNNLTLVAKFDFKIDGYTIVGTVPVGDGPVGIDLMELDGGNIAIASTGFNDDTYSVTVVTPAGAVVSNEKMNLPTGAEGPGHVVWLGDAAMRLLVTCNTTGNVAVVDSGLQ